MLPSQLLFSLAGVAWVAGFWLLSMDEPDPFGFVLLAVGTSLAWFGLRAHWREWYRVYRDTLDVLLAELGRYASPVSVVVDSLQDVRWPQNLPTDRSLAYWAAHWGHTLSETDKEILATARAIYTEATSATPAFNQARRQLSEIMDSWAKSYGIPGFKRFFRREVLSEHAWSMRLVAYLEIALAEKTKGARRGGAARWQTLGTRWPQL